MTQTLLNKNIIIHHLTGLPTRDLLYNSVMIQPKGDLHLIFFTITGFPYPNLDLREGDRLIAKTAKLLTETLPEEASLYQWRDSSFAVLLPYYKQNQAQDWQEEVLLKAHKIKTPANVLTKFRLSSTMVSSPPVPKKDLLKAGELELLAIEQKITEFSFFPISAYTAKAKEYTNFALAKLWAKEPYFVYLHNAAAFYAKEIARTIGLAENIQANLVTAALWQDVAMNEIPLNILDCTSPLDEYEWEQIKKHPLIGAELLKYLKLDANIYETVRYHHENWNGTGYPDKLKGDDIPLNARILRLATSWAALQLPRPWRNSYKLAEALVQIQKASGTYYDPALVSAFRTIVPALPKPQDLIFTVT